VITSLTWDLLHSATSLVLLTAFRLWPLFCSVSTFTLQLFQILSVFRYHQGPTQTRSHFPVHTYWAAAAREREGGGKRGMRLAHTVYIRFRLNIPRFEKPSDIIIKMFWVLGSYCPFPEKKGLMQQSSSQMANFLVTQKLTIKMESIIVGARFKIIHSNWYDAQELIIGHT